MIMLKKLYSDVTDWFPSEDGNMEKREEMLKLIEQLIAGVDELKNTDGVNLKGEKHRENNYYRKLMKESNIPHVGTSMEEVNKQLLQLLYDHPYHSKYFFTNILPMASVPGLLGMLTAMLVNGNNLWDVYGPAGAEAEVRVTSMMSKLIGYNEEKSGGYTTWGGQGAVFSGLRIAIAKHDPNAPKHGVPGNLYAFCSEAAHYSLFKSMEATGIGSEHLIKIQTLSDSSMDPDDLERKMYEVIVNGGIPIYIVATTGTTDAIGIDDINLIRNVAVKVTGQAGLPCPHIHADSALGGFFAFFNEYNLKENSHNFSFGVIDMIEKIQAKIKYLNLADSLCFDFQKLGQTPYVSSLFLVKDAMDFNLLDLSEAETPYVGHRGYGDYHTGYTMECTRGASSISMYSSLLSFGFQGYQRLFGQFLEVNLEFRKQLVIQIPEVDIANPDNYGISTLFRIYPPNGKRYEDEVQGRCTLEEIKQTNSLNERLFEMLGEQRDQMFFGDTKKHLIVSTTDGYEVPLYVSKFFVISPHTKPELVGEIIEYLKTCVNEVYKQVFAMV